MYTLYFYCEWSENPTVLFRENVSMDVLSICTTYGEVQWRRKDAPGGVIKVVVMGNQPLERGQREEIIDKSLFSILKSNLQKQVRLRDTHSVGTSNAMWRSNTFELLRRVPIIAFEDSIPSTELMVVVWMMCVVSKGHLLNEEHKEWILRYIHRLTLTGECMYRSLPKSECYTPSFELNEISPMDPQREFIMCMLFRCSYGGLKHDPHMIMGMLYTVRLKRHKLFLKELPATEEFTVPPFQILSSAVDHHCYPGIINALHKLYPQYDQELLKRVLWECSSSTNVRCIKSVDKEYIKVWNTLKEDLYSLILVYVEKVYTVPKNLKFVKQCLKKE